MNNTSSMKTRNSILEAAESLFVRGGFDGTSMSAIAKQASVNQSLISHHFGSKKGLWEATRTRAYMRYFGVQKRLLDLPDEQGTDILRNSISQYFKFLANNPEAVRLQAWLYLDHHKHSFPAAEDVIKLGFDRLKDGQDQGLIRKDVPAPFIWATFIGMAHGWSQLRDEYADLFSDGGFDPDNLDEAFLDAFLKIFFEGIGDQK